MQSGYDGTGDVRDIREHTGTDAFRNLTDSFEVDDARISRRATDKQLWLVFFGEPLQFVVIDRLSLARDSIVGNLVTQARKVQRMSVRQVPAMRQIHSQDLIAVMDRREIDGHVRLRTAVRLHIRMIRSEQFLCAIDGRLLDDVGVLTATVVTLARIAFSVLVGEDGTGRFEHGFTDKVLAGD